MATQEETYLRKAVECDERAAELKDEDLRQGWLQMAAEWRALAANARRRETPR
jgi:hypothetical protein